MKPTGKNLEQFTTWFHTDGEENFNGLDNIVQGYAQPYDAFELLPFSMQQGVYLEYYDSVGCYITIIVDSPLRNEWDIWYKKSLKAPKGRGKSRQEALTEAFKKADELINKRS